VAREARYIVFSYEEALAAIVNWRRSSGRPLPPGTVTSFVLHEDSARAVALLRWMPDKGGEALSMEFAADEIKEALLGYCRYRSIPLPRRSIKRLEIVNQSVALLLTLDLRAMEPRVVGGEVRYESTSTERVRREPAAEGG